MNFDHIAPFYDTLASLVFLGNIRKSQIECLRAVSPKGKVLIIGGGTGWIIPHIFESGQVERLFYVEASQRMLALSRSKCPQELHSKIEFISGDETVLPNERYDVIITNYFLDCFEKERLKEIMGILYDHLKAGGYWYFTDFQIDSDWFRRLWQKALMEFMLLFFKKTTRLESRYLVDFDSLFEDFDMDRIREMDYFNFFIRAILWEKRVV